MQFFIPEYVKIILNTIEKAGGEAYIVGGCVRDMLLGKSPSDFDVTTSLEPERIIELFDKTVATGLKHGTVTVIVNNSNVEVTTYRTDGAYSDSRHPESVNFVKNLKEDLSRRDFTVNALAYNPKEGIIDCFEGQKDLKNKVLRTVGDPHKRFQEDALRIMRLFRFSAQLDFTIEESTQEAALKQACDLEGISRERIATELFKTVLSDFPQRLNPLLSTGVLKFCSLNKGNISSDISSLPKDRDIRFFAFLSELGAEFEKVCKELKTDKALPRFCSEVIILLKNAPDDVISCKKALRNYSRKAVYCAMLLKEKNTSLIELIENSGEAYKISHLDITGDDLKELNIKGKAIGNCLEKLLTHVMENPADNKKEKLIKIIYRQ